jgi:XTP/dITP diphosphohydrolase
MQLVLATKNRDKIREIKRVLEDLPLTILAFDDFLEFPDIEETGMTIEDNAKIKAAGIEKFAGYPALADDSGLEVEYLNGSPGVYSSRYAGPGCSYDDNNRKLLSQLDGVPWEKRRAKFRTVIAIAWNGDRIEVVDGSIDGFIAAEKKGESGFGYDPIFYYPPAGKTFAEMTLDEKNAVSHRGQALLKARAAIIKYLNL